MTAQHPRDGAHGARVSVEAGGAPRAIAMGSLRFSPLGDGRPEEHDRQSSQTRGCWGEPAPSTGDGFLSAKCSCQKEAQQGRSGAEQSWEGAAESPTSLPFSLSTLPFREGDFFQERLLAAFESQLWINNYSLFTPGHMVPGNRCAGNEEPGSDEA